MARMYQQQAIDTFKNIVRTMGIDNGCRFNCTSNQIGDGAFYVLQMSDAGAVFPMDGKSMVAAMNDLDSIYWRLAAGEQSEMDAEFSRFKGFAELNKLLNEIFES